MTSPQITEGSIPFPIPSIDTDTKTWYQIHGPPPSSTTTTPLVVLHGGPGIPHNYLLPLTDLALTHSIPIIFYDQIGCGKSTRLPFKKHDAEFWTVELFLSELDNLLAHLNVQENYNIIGQSWGGMLGACHAIRQPSGLKKLIIANSPADMGSWLEAANRLRTELPEDVQEVLNTCEREGKAGSGDYEKAMMVFYERHVCRVKPLPGYMEESFRQLKEDDTVYLTMNGPSEFNVTGSLKTWDIRKEVHRIKVPTLLLNGRYDEAQDEVVEPYFRAIEKVKWYRFAESSHTPQLEEREEFMKTTLESRSHWRRDVDPSALYPEHNISVPIDYFHNETIYEPHSNGTFSLRYWFDASYYQDGGPVIVLQSGETDGEGRLPFLQKGLLHQLAQATNGIGVVLEHRYYGRSFPTSDLTTPNLRFLTTEQALADMAYFAKNVVFEGLEDRNLTAPGTAYFGYGGSYAGAFVAFLRVQYPDIYYGVISSSGVTEAIWDFWQYYEPVRQYGPPDCISTHTKLINVADNILLNNTAYTALLKSAFGLSSLTYTDDFAQVLSYPIGGWQGRNWDPAINDPSFSEYCSNLTSPTLISNTTTTANQTQTAHLLLAAGGYANQTALLTTPLLNFITYIRSTYVQPTLAANRTLDQAYNTHNQTFYAQASLSATWRSWPYQYCTQWGFLTGSSVPPAAGLPLVSRLLTLEYNSLICKLAFNITSPPNTAAINDKYGGFDIAYDRLAIVDGEQDPWRGASPHAGGRERRSTTERPFLLIEGAVHHWDENGVFGNETREGAVPPRAVREVQKEEVRFVRAWVEEWRKGEGRGKR
ncbi:MAG: hypothetical protein Q9208_002582 [Pyrenodesmia sp. 3 TL-2023]